MDFKLVLDEPASPIDNTVMATCASLFAFLLTRDPNSEAVSYGGMMVKNLISFGFPSYIRKDDALARVVRLCNQFLDKGSFDEAFFAGLPEYDKAAEYVKTFLTDITDNGKYEYTEDIT